VAFWDTLFYVIAQFAGAVGGVGIAAYVLRGAPENPAVRYAVRALGIFGNAGAFAGEVTISFILMTAILFASNREALTRYTPYFVGGPVCDIPNLRNSTVRDEHVSRAKLWFSVSRRLLASPLGLFDCAHPGHAGRCRAFFVGSSGYRSLLRKAVSRQ
jgi:hypothetical protein